MTGLILVHGSHGGGWSWERVQDLLKVPSVAVDLPGRGTRAQVANGAGLKQCADAVIEEADAAGLSRFVLVGHSHGAMTITETALLHPDRVAHLVYVAAPVPPPGRRVIELYPANTEELERDNGDVSGFRIPLPARVVRSLFCVDVSEDVFLNAYRRLVPEPVELLEATTSGMAEGVRTTYVRCTRDIAVPKQIAEAAISLLRPSLVHEIDSDHDVLLSHPALVTEILHETMAAVANERN